MTAILVPQLSLSMEEARVSRWLVDDVDAVVAGQLVVEVETDNATVEIEAPAAGRASAAGWWRPRGRVRPRMWVNVAIDHRAADGRAGGRLLAALERQIALLPGGPA